MTWGIIRYAPNSGTFPDEDAACFDGWYSNRDEALEVFNLWVRAHPQWIVALVSSDLINNERFGDFRGVGPLTVREHRFAARARLR